MYKSIMQASESVILEIRDVSYTYESETKSIWSHLNFQFYEGKIHAIIGPSGCGKSSILNLLQGLIPHMLEGTMEGSVWFYGNNITDVLPRDRCDRIGFVMQNPESQFCTFTVEEELAFGMENLGLSPETMKERIHNVLEYVGMQGYETRDLNQLSGGQKQKITIASVLVMDPEVLLLDEPTANLDPEARTEILSLLRRLSREQQKTIILVEHNLNELCSDIDYLYEMNALGQCSFYSDPEDIQKIIHRRTASQTSSLKLKDRNENESIILELTNVKFAYNRIQKGRLLEKNRILDGIELRIRDRDFIAVLGKNGVGKSTLLKLIFGIHRMQGGDIRLYGKSIESYKKKELYQRMGLVFQNPENQFVANTVWDELLFSLKKERISEAEKETRVFNVLKQFHLEHVKEKSPFVLSQGQKRRLSVATMLLTGQTVLFLDEPTYGQDYDNRHELMRDLQQLNESGTTIVMITHDISLVEQYTNRVVVLENGRVSMDVSTQEYSSIIKRKESL